MTRTFSVFVFFNEGFYKAAEQTVLQPHCACLEWTRSPLVQMTHCIISLNNSFWGFFCALVTSFHYSSVSSLQTAASWKVKPLSAFTNHCFCSCVYMCRSLSKELIFIFFLPVWHDTLSPPPQYLLKTITTEPIHVLTNGFLSQYAPTRPRSTYGRARELLSTFLSQTQAWLNFAEERRKAASETQPWTKGGKTWRSGKLLTALVNQLFLIWMTTTTR